MPPSREVIFEARSARATYTISPNSVALSFAGVGSALDMGLEHAQLSNGELAIGSLAPHPEQSAN